MSMKAEVVINCEKPRIILHPLAVERIQRFKNVTIKGVSKNVYLTKNALYYHDTKELSPNSNCVGKDDIADCYITDYRTAEVYPLYIEVPCGHCACCKNAKILSLVNRCEMESQLYDSKPIFITLTYDNENYPQDGLCVRDVQLFFKRLRIGMQRHGYRNRIRYLCCGEYGKNTHRAHYHALLWNCGQQDIRTYREICSLIGEAWSKGFVMCREVDASDNKTFFYTAKYLRKDCRVPRGFRPPFVLASRGRGGIGARFIDGLAGEIQKKFVVEPKFVNKFSGRVRNVIMSKYVLNRVFPSLSTSLPGKLKNALRQFNVNYALLYYKDHRQLTELFKEKYEAYNSRFRTVLYCPQMFKEKIAKSLQVPLATAYRKLLEAERVIQCYYDKGKEYVSRSVRLSNARNVYLTKLFEHADELTESIVQYRGYLARHAFAAAARREVL